MIMLVMYEEDCAIFWFCWIILNQWCVIFILMAAASSTFLQTFVKVMNFDAPDGLSLKKLILMSECVAATWNFKRDSRPKFTFCWIFSCQTSLESLNTLFLHSQLYLQKINGRSWSDGVLSSDDKTDDNLIETNGVLPMAAVSLSYPEKINLDI